MRDPVPHITSSRDRPGLQRHAEREVYVQAQRYSTNSSTIAREATEVPILVRLGGTQAALMLWALVRFAESSWA